MRDFAKAKAPQVPDQAATAGWSPEDRVQTMGVASVGWTVASASFGTYP
jgi:hypothetical protein